MPSKIEWTDATWNPVSGCSKVSPGCAHCYAETLSLRFGYSNKPWTPANALENVVLHPERLTKPFSWKKPRRIFVNSMSDLFHEQAPDAFIDQVFAVMALTPWHTYQVLTKRPKRMQAYLTQQWLTTGRATFNGGPWPEAYNRVEEAYWNMAPAISPGVLNQAAAWQQERFPDSEGFMPAWPLPNVWLGVSVENQRWADERIPVLLQTPTTVRFLSCEPLLGPLDISRYFYRCTAGCDVSSCQCTGLAINWVIIGGESGQHMNNKLPKGKRKYAHRWMKKEWAQSIVDQCRAAGAAVFFKQASGVRPGTEEDLLGEKIQEMPDVKAVLRTAMP